MAKVYAALIKKGLKTIDDVPKICATKSARSWRSKMIRRFRSWLRKEVNNMAVIYVALIVKGKRTYDSVPDLIKPQVKEMLIDLELAELVTE